MAGGAKMKGTFWTTPEDEQLIFLRESGDTLRQIADQIEGRSFDGVNARLRILQRKKDGVR